MIACASWRGVVGIDSFVSCCNRKADSLVGGCNHGIVEGIALSSAQAHVDDNFGFIEPVIVDNISGVVNRLNDGCVACISAVVVEYF